MTNRPPPTTKPADHPAVKPAKVGVLLVNLGTPDAPDAPAVRRYLKEFLSDRRVVEIPALIWQPILRGIILNTRPKKSAHAYSQVWTDEGSPLLAITKAQATKLQARFAASSAPLDSGIKGDVHVDFAMRYGNPSIAAKLAAMKDAGCDRILIAPLYPQYCGATTATVVDEVARVLATMRWQPTLRTLPPYYEDPIYIAALAETISADLATLNFTPDAILASFHGMPERTLQLGDPYHCQCLKTARLLSDALGRPLIPTFQSRFGKAKWIEPYTDATLEQLARSGTKKLTIIAPGFSADCLETLEELAMRGKEQFLAAGGTDFAYMPCLNTTDSGMAMLYALIGRELSGWI